MIEQLIPDKRDAGHPTCYFDWFDAPVVDNTVHILLNIDFPLFGSDHRERYPIAQLTYSQFFREQAMSEETISLSDDEFENPWKKRLNGRPLRSVPYVLDNDQTLRQLGISKKPTKTSGSNQVLSPGPVPPAKQDAETPEDPKTEPDVGRMIGGAHILNEIEIPKIVDYKRVRAAIEHENGLINQRLTWLLSSHVFLFAAFFLLLNEGFAQILKARLEGMKVAAAAPAQLDIPFVIGPMGAAAQQAVAAVVKNLPLDEIAILRLAMDKYRLAAILIIIALGFMICVIICTATLAATRQLERLSEWWFAHFVIEREVLEFEDTAKDAHNHVKGTLLTYDFARMIEDDHPPINGIYKNPFYRNFSIHTMPWLFLIAWFWFTALIGDIHIHLLPIPDFLIKLPIFTKLPVLATIVFVLTVGLWMVVIFIDMHRSRRLRNKFWASKSRRATQIGRQAKSGGPK